MSKILMKLENVSLVYPVLTVQSQSIRHTLINKVTGGKMMKDTSNIVHVRALDKLDFELFEGDRLGIIGHNGSGKTTLLKVLAGIFEPTSGNVLAAGNISSMIDLGTGIDLDATGYENIKMLGRLRGLNDKEIDLQVEDIVNFADLGSFIDLPIRTYSSGMTMRLLFSISTSFSPEIIVLDEWLGAGDVEFVAKAEERMEQFVSNSKLLVLASHNHDMIQRRCNKILVLERGSTKFFGSPAEWYKDGVRL